MFYDKEKALEKARDLSRRIREKTEPFDPEAELAAALLEAQAGVLKLCAARADDSWMYDNAARLRATAAELREE